MGIVKFEQIKIENTCIPLVPLVPRNAIGVTICISQLMVTGQNGELGEAVPSHVQTVHL